MKKNVIRLTEAELKQYISKVVKEQTADPAAAGESNKEKVVALSQAFVGKNIQLYLDTQKTKKSHIVKVKSIGVSADNTGAFFFYVDDLAFVTSTGGAMNPTDNMGKIEILRFDCKAPMVLVAMMGSGSGLGQVFCPPFSELVRSTAACATIDKTPTFASAKPGVQSNVAETVRVDIG